MKSLISLLLPICVTISAIAQQVDEKSAFLPDTVNTDNKDIVTIHGFEENALSLVGNIYSIDYEEISGQHSLNLLTFLSGRVPGLDVITSTSGNSGQTRLLSRGNRGFWNKMLPLFVVDGHPLVNDLSFDMDHNHGNIINDWGLDDIESISFIKGAVASGIYGPYSGNGVVLIRTRRPKKEGLKVEFNSSLYFKELMGYPDFQNEYGEGKDGEFSFYEAGGEIYNYDSRNFGPPLDGRMVPQFDGISIGLVDGTPIPVRGGDIVARQLALDNGYDVTISPTPWVSHGDPMRFFFKTGVTLANNLSLTYKKNNSGISASYTNFRSEDVTPGIGLNRNTIFTSFQFRPVKKLHLGVTVNFTSLENRSPLISQGNYYLNPMIFFGGVGRQVSSKSLQDYWQVERQGQDEFNYTYTGHMNPWFIAGEGSSVLDHNHLNTTYTLSYSPAEKISVNLTGGVDYFNSEGNRVLPVMHWTPSDFRFENEDRSGIYHTIGINTTIEEIYISNHKISLTAGVNRFASNMESYNGWKSSRGYGWNSSSYETNNLAFYSIINYNFTDYLTSRFALSTGSYKRINNEYNLENEYVIYPSISIGTNLIKAFDLDRYFSQLELALSYSVGGFQEYGSPPVNISNRDNGSPGDQKIREFTAGTTISFPKNRLLMLVNYYINTSENMVVEKFDPSSFYTNSYTGSIQNRGFEARINYQVIDKHSFSWNTGISLFYNKSNILYLMDNKNYIFNHRYIYYVIGKPVGELSGSGALRHDNQIVYIDGIPQRNPERVHLGNIYPDFVLMLNNTLSIRGVTLYLLFDLHKGGQYISDFNRFATESGSLNSTLYGRENGVLGKGLMYDDATTEYRENDVIVSPRDYYYYVSQIGENNVMDASSIVLREATLSYDIFNGDKFSLRGSLFCRNILLWKATNDYWVGNIPGLQPTLGLPDAGIFGIKLNLSI